jgi:hypothetical protein
MLVFHGNNLSSGAFKLKRPPFLLWENMQADGIYYHAGYSG